MAAIYKVMLWLSSWLPQGVQGQLSFALWHVSLKKRWSETSSVAKWAPPKHYDHLVTWSDHWSNLSMKMVGSYSKRPSRANTCVCAWYVLTISSPISWLLRTHTAICLDCPGKSPAVQMKSRMYGNYSLAELARGEGRTWLWRDFTAWRKLKKKKKFKLVS